MKFSTLAKAIIIAFACTILYLTFFNTPKTVISKVEKKDSPNLNNKSNYYSNITAKSNLQPPNEPESVESDEIQISHLLSDFEVGKISADELYENIFLTAESQIRKDIINVLFSGLSRGDDAYQMFVNLIQQGVEVDTVISQVDFLTFNEAEIAYLAVKEYLNDTQRKNYLNGYISSANMNLYEDTPEVLSKEFEKYNIKPNYQYLYASIIDFGDTDSFYLNNPKAFDFLSNPPPDYENKSNIIMWYGAFLTVYKGTGKEIEVIEKLKHNDNYSWVVNMSLEELKNANVKNIMENLKSSSTSKER